MTDTAPMTDTLRLRIRSLPWRDVERPALVMAWVAGLLLAAQALVVYIPIGWVGEDSHAYWMTGHSTTLYGIIGGHDAYLYSPAFAQVIWPLTLLSWPVFCGLWMALEVAAFAWLFRPLGWRWVLPLTVACAAEWTMGNIIPFLGIAVVLGMRRSGWWAAVVLAKPVMALGPVWFAVRGEWRRVAVSAATTVALVAVSYVIAPGDWHDWIEFLGNKSDQSDAHLLPRVAVAVVLVVFGARHDARWVLPLAMIVAAPVYAGSATFTLIAVVPRLLLDARAARDTTTDRLPHSH